jgi:hypothetical protein
MDCSVNKSARQVVCRAAFLTTQLHLLKRLAPKSSVTTKSVTKMKNKTFAIEAAPAAMPPNPKMAAMIAIIKNVIDQRNIFLIV